MTCLYSWPKCDVNYILSWVRVRVIPPAPPAAPTIAENMPGCTLPLEKGDVDVQPIDHYMMYTYL